MRMSQGKIEFEFLCVYNVFLIIYGRYHMNIKRVKIKLCTYKFCYGLAVDLILSHPTVCITIGSPV